MPGDRAKPEPKPAELRKRTLINQAQKAAQAEARISRRQVLQLTPVDHTIARHYVRVHLSFRFEGDKATRTKALARLQHAYEVALRRWPFLAGEVLPNNCKKNDILSVSYMLQPSQSEASEWCDGGCPEIEAMPWTYEELMRWGAPPGWLSDSLYIFEKSDAHAQLYASHKPVMCFSQTFVEGGLVLSFAFHHAVMDGPSFKMFLQLFALACGPGNKIWTNSIPDTIQDRHAELAFLMPAAENVQEGYDPVAHCDEYNPGPDRRRPGKDGKAVIFQLKHSVLLELKTQVTNLMSQRGYTGWVSTTDCLCGLIWVAVMRARACRLKPSETEVKFTTAVDARGRVSKPLRDYMGNLIVAATARTTIGQLLGDDSYRLLQGHGTPQERRWLPRTHEVLGIRNDISVECITSAATAIRNAIRSVDEHYVKHRMAIGPGNAVKIRTTKAYPRAVDAANTGIDFSSWKDWLDGAFDPRGKMFFEHPPVLDGRMRFDIPGVKTPYPDFLRASNPQSEGSCVLLPRRTGGKAGEYAPWEVSLCLRTEEMDFLRLPTEFGGWIGKVFGRELSDLERHEPKPLPIWGVVGPKYGEQRYHVSDLVRAGPCPAPGPALSPNPAPPKRQKIEAAASEATEGCADLPTPMNLTED